MRFIVPDTIRKMEFDPLKELVGFENLKEAAKKSLFGIGETIKSPQKIPGTRLRKVYVTSRGGAARAIFLMQLGQKGTIFIMLRLKKEKRVGENMTVENPEFRKVLQRNIKLAINDMDFGRYETIEIE